MPKNKLPPYAEKVRSLRKGVLSMNQARFAEALGVTQSSVSKWEGGAYPPSPELYMRIASLCPPEQASEWMGLAGIGGAILSKRATRIDTGFKSVPLSAYPAGAGRGTLHETKETEGKLSLPLDLINGEMVCVRIQGDSMEPLIPDRSIAAVDRLNVNVKRLLGRVVAAEHDDHGVIVKRLCIYEDKLMLVSENPRYAPIEFTPGWRIDGRVEWWIVRQR